ncbi:queuine tRNA-ribosyltransferase-like protein [Babesia caballi]|uniref:Small ribosomal subunit protein mS23 n=1 Tax=Babesia caballi TaxID=5871 RepID=A0AAV4LRI3_BABCB|nr:queuine tRNA-ribosyltransferase-like protein [Babesia caballi]
MRKLVRNGTCDRPRWLEWVSSSRACCANVFDQVERAPPLETRNMLHGDRTIRNPYLPLIETLLQKYPHLRFEQCFRPENQWQKGNSPTEPDRPRRRPRQLRRRPPGHAVRRQPTRAHEPRHVAPGRLCKSEDCPWPTDAAQTERMFYKRRMEIEARLKVAMALAVDEDVEPLYTTGYAYWHVGVDRRRSDTPLEKNRTRARHLPHSRQGRAKVGPTACALHHALADA